MMDVTCVTPRQEPQGPTPVLPGPLVTAAGQGPLRSLQRQGRAATLSALSHQEVGASGCFLL